MNRLSPTIRSRRNQAVTLPELLIVIAVIGILAAIAIPSITGMREAASEGFSGDAVAMANRAVLHYEQANEPIGVDAAAGSVDEEAVIAMLKYRDPVAPVPGSPFLDPSFPDVAGSSTETHRMIWNNSRFEVLLPGEAGTGILLNTD